MIFIMGGRFQGKLQFAKEKYREQHTICDLQLCSMQEALKADILTNFEAGIKQLLNENVKPGDFFTEYWPVLENKIIIGNEIGCGIVPVDASDRLWRDETGWAYQYLARKASAVYRVWAGIGIKL